ncbi:hypothetical protein C7B76_15920 [filamentous cyanobacterium CCP2]|nr:hypothetical protein C7B76_15920 [filamentous cyanobacterium CCP2]
MNELDVIIVVIFLIITTYVVMQAISSVDKQVKIDFDSKGVEQQLEAKQFSGLSLKDIVKIGFKFDSRYKYSMDKVEDDKTPRSLALSIENVSNKTDREIYLYIYWDKSTLTDHENESRRVIHLDGNKQLTDLIPPKTQLPSPVSPGMKFGGNLTAEELLKLDEAKKILEPTTPILNISKIKATSKNKKVPKNVREALEKKLSAFEDGDKPLKFTLLLMLQLRDLTDNVAIEEFRSIRCDFTMTAMPWHDQLPWNPKK